MLRERNVPIKGTFDTRKKLIMHSFGHKGSPDWMRVPCIMKAHSNRGETVRRGMSHAERF